MQAGVRTAADPSAGLVWLLHEVRPHHRAFPCVCGGTRSQGSGAETNQASGLSDLERGTPGSLRSLKVLVPSLPLLKVSPGVKGVWCGHVAKPHRCATGHPKPLVLESRGEDRTWVPGGRCQDRPPGRALAWLCQILAVGR